MPPWAPGLAGAALAGGVDASKTHVALLIACGVCVLVGIPASSRLGSGAPPPGDLVGSDASPPGDLVARDEPYYGGASPAG